MKLKLTEKTEVNYNLVEMSVWQNNFFEIDFLYKKHLTESGEIVAIERYNNVEEALERFKEVTEGLRK